MRGKGLKGRTFVLGKGAPTPKKLLREPLVPLPERLGVAETERAPRVRLTWRSEAL